MEKHASCTCFVALAVLCCLLAVTINIYGQTPPSVERAYNLTFIECEMKSWNTKYVKNVKKSFFYVNRDVKNKGVILNMDIVLPFTNEVWVYAEYMHRKDDQSPWSVKNTLRNISLCDVMDTPEELWARMYSMVRDQLPRQCPWPKGAKLKLKIDILEDKFPPKMPGKEFSVSLVFYEHLPQNQADYGPEKRLLELRGYVKLEGEA